MTKNKFMETSGNYWTNDEFDTLVNMLTSNTPMKEMIKALPNRTPGSLYIKIQAINKCLAALTDEKFKEEVHRYAVKPYFRDLISDLKKRGFKGFLNPIAGYNNLRKQPKATNGTPPTIKVSSAKDLIRTVDETFDALKDSLVDLVEFAVNERMKEKEEQFRQLLKEKDVEVASLRVVVDAAKKSSLVERLQSKLMGAG